MARKVPLARPSVEQYLALREVGKALNNRMSLEVEPETYDEALVRLDMLNEDGTIGVESEYDLVIAVDYAIYDLRDDEGRNIVDRFAARHAGKLSAEQRHVLEGLRAARYDVVMVRKAVAGEGLEVVSMLELGPAPFFLSDVSLGSSGRRDMILATRLVTVDGVHMTSGTALYAHDAATYLELMAFLTAWLAAPPTEDPAEFSAAVINLLLDAGASVAMRTHDPRKPLPGRRSRGGKGGASSKGKGKGKGKSH